MSCEEKIYTLDNPDAREKLSISVALGIQHSLTAAFQMHKLDDIKSIDQITDLKEATLGELKSVPCYYCYDVYVVTGRKSD